MASNIDLYDCKILEKGEPISYGGDSTVIWIGSY